MSQLHYEMGEIEDALREVRECLKLDQDHKKCHPFYKVIAKEVFYETYINMVIF